MQSCYNIILSPGTLCKWGGHRHLFNSGMTGYRFRQVNSEGFHYWPAEVLFTIIAGPFLRVDQYYECELQSYIIMRDIILYWIAEDVFKNVGVILL